MAWRCSARTNPDLITNLYKANLITSDRLRQAMTLVDRAHYAPHLPTAYDDSPQSIGFSATISAPHMHAAACESLLPFLNQDGESETRVLDVGSGSGYLTHVLAMLVCGGDADGNGSGSGGSGGKVIGIDHIPGLTALSTTNMSRSASGRHLLDSGKVEFITGDGRLGYKAGGPYDAIHVGAAASVIHEELISQLKSPGRMFIPVEDEGERGIWGAQSIWVVDKDGEGNVRRRKDMGVRYVLLTDRPDV